MHRPGIRYVDFYIEIFVIWEKFEITGKILKTLFKVVNIILLLILVFWFLFELSEVISVISDPSRYPFGHKGSGWRYRTEEVYLISRIIGSVVTMLGIIFSFLFNKKAFIIRFGLCLAIFLVILEFRFSIS